MMSPHYTEDSEVKCKFANLKRRIQMKRFTVHVKAVRSQLIIAGIILIALASSILPAQAQESSHQLFLPMVANTNHQSSACTMNEQEQQLAKQIQALPGQRRSTFTCNPILAGVAKAHAIDMATRRYFSSTNPEGVGPNHRVRQAGYRLPDYYSAAPTGNNIESIAAGYRSAEGVWEALANNSQLQGGEEFWAAQTQFGIAYYHDPTSPFADYWVILTAPPSR